MPPAHPSDLRVRPVLAGEGGLLRRLRLASLATDPDAFLSTYAREAGRPAEWWEQWAARSGEGATQRTFVPIDGADRCVGLALVRLDEGSPGSAVLNAMWVMPEVRGRRAAGMLCDACAGWAAERGCTEVTLAVVVGNLRAQRAYERAGFGIRGRVEQSRDGRTLVEFAMARAL